MTSSSIYQDGDEPSNLKMRSTISGVREEIKMSLQTRERGILQSRKADLVDGCSLMSLEEHHFLDRASPLKNLLELIFCDGIRDPGIENLRTRISRFSRLKLLHSYISSVSQVF